MYFMDNLLMPQTVDGIRGGTYAVPLPADVSLQQVTIADIGAFGAYVVDNRDAFVGRRVDIAGDELTSTQSAEVLTRVLGRPIAHFEVPMDQIHALSEDLALMYERFISTGYTDDVEGLRGDVPQSRLAPVCRVGGRSGTRCHMRPRRTLGGPRFSRWIEPEPEDTRQRRRH